MMKKILLSFCFLISGLTLAQSNLPACISPPFNNCYGELKLDNGDRYIGEFKNNDRNGQGAYTFVDGRQYVGQFKDGNYDGFGTFIFPNGEKYVGQWKDSQRNGQGTNTWSDGGKHVGQFKDNQRNGQGTFTFADGKKYVGQYSNDKRNGLGTLYSPNGTILQQGLWRDGNFVQTQSITPTIVPVVPKPPAITSNPQEIKRQKCIRLGLAPGSTDFQQCMN
jgi:hypothetical protein